MIHFNYSKYYHTIKHLKLKQIFYRILYRYKRIKVCRPLLLTTRNQINKFILPICKPQQIFQNNTAIFLNHIVNIEHPNIWNDSKQEKLWLYNLHYFDDLVSNSNSLQDSYLQNLIHRWINENPPLLGTGWEPYPLSLRIVNLIKWHLCKHSLDKKSLENLEIQLDVLAQKIEWHLLGNHLLANAKALIFGGLFFCSPKSERWLQNGLKIFNLQIAEQILKDGGHFERSAMYHAIIFEDCLDLANICYTYAYPIPDLWLKTIPKMFLWLQKMLHPDGGIPFFNDATLNIAAGFEQLSSYLNRMEFLQEKCNLEASTSICVTKIPINNFAIAKCFLLESSGFCRLQNIDATLLCDIGSIGPSYLPGHAHAGTLSFEFSLQKKRIFVNSGISTYQPGMERLRQRSSAAHNTLVINGQNSSQVWGGFRVAKRAKVHNIELNNNSNQFTLRAEHTGYVDLPQKISHCRVFKLKTKQLCIEDYIYGHGSAEVFIYYHLHPDYVFELKSKNTLRIIEKQSGTHIAELYSENNASIIPSTYHPSFGIAISSQCCRIGGECINLPNVFKLNTTWS